MTKECEPCGSADRVCCGGIEGTCNSGLSCEGGVCIGCEIINLKWQNSQGKNISRAVDGQTIYALVTGSSSCEGEKLDSLIIYEKDDALLDRKNDEIYTTPSDLLAFASDNKVNIPWKAVFLESDASPENTFLFKTNFNDLISQSPTLELIWCNEVYQLEEVPYKIQTCSDYNNLTENNKVQCEADCTGAAVKEASSLAIENTQNAKCIYTNKKCELAYSTDADPDLPGFLGEEFICRISYSTMQECVPSDNYRTVSFSSDKINLATNIAVSDLNNDCSACQEENSLGYCEREVLCPKITKLPFFTFFNFLLAIITISLVYALIGIFKNRLFSR